MIQSFFLQQKGYKSESYCNENESYLTTHLFVLAHRCINSSKYKCIISLCYSKVLSLTAQSNKTSSKDLVMIPKQLSTHFLLLICTSIIHFNFEKQTPPVRVMKITVLHSLAFCLYGKAVGLSQMRTVSSTISYLQFVSEQQM